MTSAGDFAGKVNIKELLANLFHRMSDAETNLVQLCEHSSRLDGLNRALANHPLVEPGLSTKTSVSGLTSLRVAAQQSHHSDDSNLEMSLSSDLLSSQCQSQFIQELHKLRHEFDHAMQQSTQAFQQDLEGVWQSTSATTASVSASGQQLAVLNSSIGHLQHAQEKQQFNLQFSKQDCKQEVRLLNHKVAAVANRCDKQNQREQELSRQLAVCEQFLADHTNKWQQVILILSTKLQAIDISVNKQLNQQIRLMRQCFDQEIQKFYECFGCRGFSDFSEDTPGKTNQGASSGLTTHDLGWP